MPRNYLLQNDGPGRFTDVTQLLAPALARAGMVSSAAWLDYDNDGQLDLIVVGEWMPVRVFRQQDGRFVERTAEAGLGDTHGWWNTVAAVDLRGNGRKDLVLGNLGRNSYIRASAQELLADDFDGDGHTDLLVAGNFHGVTPVRGRYDASYGLLLRGDGQGGLVAVDLETSGLVIEGEVRAMRLLRGANGTRRVVVARNDAGVAMLELVN